MAVILVGLSAGACNRRAFESDKWLIEAVNERSLIGVMTALAEGASPNAKDAHGDPALRLAAEKHAIEIVTLLLDRGASPNGKSERDLSALHSAAWEGAVDVTTLLLDRGAEVDLKDSEGVTPLMFAAWRGHEKLVHILLSKGAAVNARSTEGETALMLALRHHMKLNVGNVRELVEHGADVNAKDDAGFSVLWMAVGHRLEVVEYLLSHGANPNAQGVLLMAVSNSNQRGLVKALLDKGADPNMRNEKGETALSLAAWSHHETAKLLLAAGAGPCEKRDREGMLISAARTGDTRVVDELLNERVDVNALSDRGESALMAAAKQGHEETVRVLLARGAAVNARTPKGPTALMVAIRAGRLAIVQALVAKHADLNTKAAGDFGRDQLMVLPLTWAEMNGQKDIVALLRKKGARGATDLQKTPSPTRRSRKRPL